MNEILEAEAISSSHPNVVEIKQRTTNLDSCSTTAASSVSALSPFRDTAAKRQDYLQDTIRDQAKKQQTKMTSVATDPPQQLCHDKFASLELTESKVEKVEAIIDNEVKLRLKVKMLEIDAIEKKEAAEKALAAALEALNTITNALPNSGSEDDASDRQLPLKPDGNSIHGTIDAAETELAEATTNIASPPAIVRQTEVPSNETEEDDVTPKVSNNNEEPPKADDDDQTPYEINLEVVTSNISMLTGKDDGVLSPRSNSITSPITSPRSTTATSPRYAKTMVDAIDTIVAKIEECSETIRSPTATTSEQIKAAQLAAQYAKTVKAFQKAM